MADMGWAFDREAGVWELADHRGRVVWSVPLDVITAGGLPEANAYGARRFRAPPLIAGVPWIHCVMDGWPLGGLHVWLDPRGYDGPPVALVFGDAPLPGMPDGGAGPDTAVAVQVTYRRMRQECGHGSWCPFRYTSGPGPVPPP